ncbi:MAG: hypothetical protein ABII07_01145 [Patescibacteria group bacterium]|nr:hypothetical protein [Patescibacteria group bacterium]
MEISLDFGGSTIDAVFWEGDRILKVETFEACDVEVADLSRFANDDVSKIYVTGGKSRFFTEEVFGIPVIKVSEIDAIGRGGTWRMADGKWLVVSMGTGTCIVSVDCRQDVVDCKHVGGTGIGGGTFLALARELLGISDLDEILRIGAKGSSQKVDLSVEDIVGGGIGRIAADSTASNLGRLAREIDFDDEDLAAGLINLIGQTIGSAAVFAAQAEKVSQIVLIGKLTKAKAVTDIIKRIAEAYDFEVFIPDNANFASAIGAKFARM